MSHRDELLGKIKILNDAIWDRRAKEPQIIDWLANFAIPANGTEDERALHALYLLSQFMYFGSRQMRELMRVLFRDLYRYPIVEGIRKANGHTTDRTLIDRKFKVALDRTLFLGVGNPSESGCHLLYYFRQENGLPKTRFIHSHEVFERRRPDKWQIFKSMVFNWKDRYAGTLTLRDPGVDRYIFVDDFCGSGHQAAAYSTDIVEHIKALNPDIEVSYFVLCGTSGGLEVVRNKTAFDIVQCVFELDDSFQCFSVSSRYFPSPWPTEITEPFAEQMCREYGNSLDPGAPLGYGNCQLLLGFQHNTPDNTLPIFRCEELGGIPWTPIFKRYPKVYG
jgi:hypothetical protein